MEIAKTKISVPTCVSPHMNSIIELEKIHEIQQDIAPNWRTDGSPHNRKLLALLSAKKKLLKSRLEREKKEKSRMRGDGGRGKSFKFGQVRDSPTQ